MSAKIAVLGLVIEEPSAPYRLTAKLRQRLASAEFVDSNVYSALSRLEREGLVRPVAVDAAQLAESEIRKPTSRSDPRRFEATPRGVRHFEDWLLASSSTPPLRDDLHIKIALCQPHNLPRLIDLVYGQELVCLGRVDELKRSFERVRAPDPSRWSGLSRVLVRDAELTFWDSRMTWLQGVRKSLEQMSRDFQGASRER
jgi:DNA-binding PadR family transcriptional regulator